jgi:hypothetical protein
MKLFADMATFAQTRAREERRAPETVDTECEASNIAKLHGLTDIWLRLTAKRVANARDVNRRVRRAATSISGRPSAHRGTLHLASKRRYVSSDAVSWRQAAPPGL